MMNYKIKNINENYNDDWYRKKLNTKSFELREILAIGENVILASKSPRRRELFKNIVSKFTVQEGREDKIEKCLPEEYVMKQARGKAESILLDEVNVDIDTLVVAADTVVSIDGEILEKPKSEDEAFNMLKRLSGREHSVFTGVSLIHINHYRKSDNKKVDFFEKTKVKFSKLNDDEIRKYISSENVMDKAGAYSIQGLAGKFVEYIDGDYFNVVGLPLYRTYNEIKKIHS